MQKMMNITGYVCVYGKYATGERHAYPTDMYLLSNDAWRNIKEKLSMFQRVGMDPMIHSVEVDDRSLSYECLKNMVDFTEFCDWCYNKES